MAEDEGRALCLKGHRLRRERKYQAAGQAFKAAADAGSAEGCFEMANALLNDGGLGFFADTDGGADYACRGAILGDAVCWEMARQTAFFAPGPRVGPDTLDARLYRIYSDCDDDEHPEPDLNADEYVMLQARCCEAGDNPWPFFYMAVVHGLRDEWETSRYWQNEAAQRGLRNALTFGLWLKDDGAARWYEKSKLAYHLEAVRQNSFGGACYLLSPQTLRSEPTLTPRDIAQAVIALVGAHSDTESIRRLLIDNTAGLSLDTISETRFWVGYLLWAHGLVEPAYAAYCLSYFKATRRRASDAVVAWLGSFKRGRLRGMCKDTTQLVARAIMASLVDWRPPMELLPQLTLKLKLNFMRNKAAIE